MTSHISRDQTVAGVSVFEVRRFFRWARPYWSLTKDHLAACLPQHPPDVVDGLWETLLAENYIGYGRTEGEPEHKDRWTLTEKGAQLSRATAAKPITRATADRLLHATCERATVMRRSSSYFAYRPARLYVYGSYLTEKERLGDLDVGVEWEPRFADREQQTKYNLTRAKAHTDSGRRFDNFSDHLDYGFRESVLFLRNRARSLSLYHIEEPERRDTFLYSIPHRLVWQRGRVVAG